MTTLSNLKIIAATRPNALSPIVKKRNKLVQRLWEQIELAKSLAEGRQHSVMRIRTVKDAESNSTKTVSLPKRIKAWWWPVENGKLCLTVRYGAKTIELAKGKSAVEVETKDGLIDVLETLKLVVENGELDSQIEAVSRTVKSSFVKITG